MEARNNAKAKLLYDYLDDSSFFSNPVNKPDRSIMNVTFTSPSPELDKKFCAEAAAAGLSLIHICHALRHAAKNTGRPKAPSSTRRFYSAASPR